MMNYQDKTRKDIIKELQELQMEHNSLKTSYKKDITECKRAEKTLKTKADELERFNNLMLGREMKMIELKKEINELLKKAGKKETDIVAPAEELPDGHVMRTWVPGCSTGEEPYSLAIVLMRHCREARKAFDLTHLKHEESDTIQNRRQL